MRIKGTSRLSVRINFEYRISVGELKSLLCLFEVQLRRVIIRRENEVNFMVTRLVIDGGFPVKSSSHLYGLSLKHETYLLKPLSGCTRSVPLNVPPLPAFQVLGFKVIALPIPPRVSPVDSLKSEGIRPNATKPCYGDYIKGY